MKNTRAFCAVLLLICFIAPLPAHAQWQFATTLQRGDFVAQWVGHIDLLHEAGGAVAHIARARRDLRDHTSLAESPLAVPLWNPQEPVALVRWERVRWLGWPMVADSHIASADYVLALDDGRMVPVHWQRMATPRTATDCTTQQYQLSGVSADGVTVTGSGAYCLDEKPTETFFPTLHIMRLTLGGTIAAPEQIEYAMTADGAP